MDLSKYACTYHGGDGNPDCSICWEKLGELLSDMNVYVSGDTPFNKMEEK